MGYLPTSSIRRTFPLAGRCWLKVGAKWSPASKSLLVCKNIVFINDTPLPYCLVIIFTSDKITIRQFQSHEDCCNIQGKFHGQSKFYIPHWMSLLLCQKCYTILQLSMQPAHSETQSIILFTGYEDDSKFIVSQDSNYFTRSE